MGDVRFEFVDVPDAEIDALEAAHAELDAEIRRLTELNIRTRGAPERIADLVARVREVGDVLEQRALPGAVGVAYNSTGRSWGWGHAATGTLTLRHRAPLPLGEVVLEGRISEERGRKVTVLASIAPVGDDGDARTRDGFPRHS